MKSARTASMLLVLSIIVTAAQLAAAEQAGDPYAALIKREFGTAKDELAAIEKQVQAAKPEDFAAIEAKLISVVENAEATMAGKQFACQMLRLVGSRKCVPAVAKLLGDEQLAHMARTVLIGMHDSSAADALREALGKAQGKARLGIIHTIGDRGDGDSLKALGELLTSGDEAVTDAALAAIGKTGGTKAADALENAKVPDAARPPWAQAYLRCAGGLAASGETARAQKMFRALLEGSYPAPVRAGAFKEIVAAEKEQAVPLIVKTLSADDKIMKRAALAGVVAVPGHAATEAFARQLGTLAAEAKATLLGALAARGDAEGLTDLVQKCAGDENATVREAALKALGRLGNASSISALVAAAKDAGTGALATQSLVTLCGEGVVDGLIKQAESGDTATRVLVLGVLADRKQTEALPAARTMLKSDDAKLRQAAVKALSELGTQDDLQILCEMILTAKDNEGDELSRAISALGAKLSDKGKRDECVMQAFGKADVPTKVRLLAVLGAFGGGKSLQTVRGALEEQGDVHKAAVRALADWPDPAPLADLRKVAKEEQEPAARILALRGAIKMIGQSKLKTEEKVQALREAMELATRPDEKRQVLSEIAKVGHLESLKIVEPCLSEESLKREALQAYESIAESLTGREPAAAKEALEKVLSMTADGGLRDKARAALEKIKK
ncbi:MAG: HEAT repeat domain-containing protein [Planctomycetota bacterium]